MLQNLLLGCKQPNHLSVTLKLTLDCLVKERTGMIKLPPSCWWEWLHHGTNGIFPTLEAAAPAKSLQSCPTLCNPRDGSPPGSAVPAILQARTLEWVAISFSISFSIYSIANTKYDFVWIATNCEKFLKRWEYQTT